MDRALNQISALDPSDVEHGPVPIGPQVVDLEPLPDYRLRLAFSNGEIGVFDVKPYLDWGIFKQLRDKAVFNEVYIEAGSVEWPGGQGLSYDTLYLKSTPEENGV